ncbi:hypothetical protein [Streptomyces sp. NPDC020489]|uniref:hypothetical protein n=1 Tax=Streptomyces sp. NPDC020489 TaxID=3365077 RepID=UPI0037953DF6
MTFPDKDLRNRLQSSLNLLTWGANSAQLLQETGLTWPRVVALTAVQDAMDCLGAKLRGEKLPKASKGWQDADNHWQMLLEQERRGEEG